MKKLISLILVLALVLSLSACGSKETSTSTSQTDTKTSQGTTWPKMEISLLHGDPANMSSSYHVLATKFAEKVTAATDGAITFVIHANGVLGVESDYFGLLKTGAADMAIMTSNGFSSVDPEMSGFFDQPFLFKDDDEANAYMDSDLQKEVDDRYPNLLGLRVLTWAEGGFRNTITNKAPIKSIADYKGQVIRVPGTASFTDTYKALGASPTPLSYSECFTAISQGAIDGMILPTGVAFSGNYYEVCKYTVADHIFFNALSICISEMLWNTLSPEVKELFIKCAAEAAAEEEEFAKAYEIECFNTMRDKHGVTVTFAEDFDTTGLSDAVAPVWEACSKVINADFYARSMKWIEEYRAAHP